MAKVNINYNANKPLNFNLQAELESTNPHHTKDFTPEDRNYLLELVAEFTTAEILEVLAGRIYASLEASQSFVEAVEAITGLEEDPARAKARERLEKGFARQEQIANTLYAAAQVVGHLVAEQEGTTSKDTSVEIYDSRQAASSVTDETTTKALLSAVNSKETLAQLEELLKNFDLTKHYIN